MLIQRCFYTENMGVLKIKNIVNEINPEEYTRNRMSKSAFTQTMDAAHNNMD